MRPGTRLRNGLEPSTSVLTVSAASPLLTLRTPPSSTPDRPPVSSHMGPRPRAAVRPGGGGGWAQNGGRERTARAEGTAAVRSKRELGAQPKTRGSAQPSAARRAAAVPGAHGGARHKREPGRVATPSSSLRHAGRRRQAPPSRRSHSRLPHPQADPLESAGPSFSPGSTRCFPVPELWRSDENPRLPHRSARRALHPRAPRSGAPAQCMHCVG